MEGTRMAVVLCTGTDLALMETRRLILQEAGHKVVTAAKPPEIAAACSKRAFDVAVIGQSISADSKRSDASLIRRHCPSAKILELYPANQHKIIEDADSWLEVPAEVPQELAQRVSRLANPEAKQLPRTKPIRRLD
jgi:DNA-binding NarL/FixJ family response regulator